MISPNSKLKKIYDLIRYYSFLDARITGIKTNLIAQCRLHFYLFIKFLRNPIIQSVPVFLIDIQNNTEWRRSHSISFPLLV